MADDANMKAHVDTYSSLIGLMKWGGVACFFIAFAVILIIAR